MMDAELVDRDEMIADALAAGRSQRAIQREFKLTAAEFDEALERYYPLDTAARLRAIRGDWGRLDRLIEKLYEKGMAGDVNAAVACIRAWERKGGAARARHCAADRSAGCAAGERAVEA